MGFTITILVGTMTGTADLVAEEVHDRLEQDGHDVEIVPMDGRDVSVFERPGIFLICSSTYGQGDVPDNAQGLFAALERERPDLSTRRFGVIALGDRTYTATFCHGGKRFDELLRALGAARIGEVMIHDASAGTIPEEVAVEWAVQWVAEIPDARDEAA
jgi:MioC protein